MSSVNWRMRNSARSASVVAGRVVRPSPKESFRRGPPSTAPGELGVRLCFAPRFCAIGEMLSEPPAATAGRIDCASGAARIRGLRARRIFLGGDTIADTAGTGTTTVGGARSAGRVVAVGAASGLGARFCSGPAVATGMSGAGSSSRKNSRLRTPLGNSSRSTIPIAGSSIELRDRITSE